METLFARLAGLGIEVETHYHPAMFTVAESKAIRGDMPGVHCKCLFLRDRKKAMWLVVALEDRRLDLKALADMIGAARLSFASADRLRRLLGVEPGSVTPFALLNHPAGDADDADPVRVVLDAEMMQASRLNYHPLTNTATTAIGPRDLLRFIIDCGYDPMVVDLAPATDLPQPA